MATEKLKHKIVIAGAGLVGTSLALCMANQAVSIELLETNLSDKSAQSQALSRPISLSFGSYRILNAIGVWDALEQFACPILSVHVSEKGRMGFTRFSAKEEKVPALGFVVPFSKLQAALFEKINAHSNITITPISSIEKIDCSENGADILIQCAAGEKIIHTDLFIAADGTHSHCRDLLKITYDKKEHDDVAHIYQLTLSEDHDNTAYERFTKLGVLAVLPLFEKNRAQLVWTMKKSASGSESEKVLTSLQDTFEGRLSIASIKKIAEFPLQTLIAEKQVVQSAVLMGNAAHTIYPVAAQGFNLGLHDVAILCEQLKKEFTVKNYEAAVLPHQQAIYKITNQLISLFELPFIGHARGLGLLATNFIFPLKNKLAKRTMGIAEKLPRWLRDHHEKV